MKQQYVRGDLELHFYQKSRKERARALAKSVKARICAALGPIMMRPFRPTPQRQPEEQEATYVVSDEIFSS